MSTFDTRLERLQTIAARVFAEKGYHPTTMRHLARETGMSLAGMYHYVSGKDELLHSIQRRYFTEVLQGAEAALAGELDPRERLERFIRHHITFFARHMSEMKVLSHEAESLSGDRLATINALKRRYVAMLSRLIRDHCDPDECEDENVASYALFGMMNWIYTWYNPRVDGDWKEVASQMSSTFLRGVLGADGNAKPVAQRKQGGTQGSRRSFA